MILVMTLLQQVKIIWSGVAGLNGYSNHYFLGGTSTAAPVASVKVFYEAIKGQVPTNLRFSYPTSGNVIDDATGQLQGGWSGGANTDTVSTAGTSFASAQGAIVEWAGMGVVDGHRPIGKTFIVPLITASIAGGILGSGPQTTIQTAASALVTATTPNFVIWHRPVKQKLPPHSVTRVGSNVQITSATVPTKLAVLTSRRD
jgi:hypothetical protein